MSFYIYFYGILKVKGGKNKKNTFKLEASRESDISSKSCRMIPSRPKGIRTEPPALTESIMQEHMKFSFSISSKLSLVLSNNSADASWSLSALPHIHNFGIRKKYDWGKYHK